jgi:hypothetical protein
MQSEKNHKSRGGRKCVGVVDPNCRKQGDKLNVEETGKLKGGGGRTKDLTKFRVDQTRTIT